MSIILKPVLKPSQEAPLILVFKKEMSYTILNKYEFLFRGNLGTWYVKPYDIKLKSDAEQIWKNFPIPRIHELTFK